MNSIFQKWFLRKSIVNWSWNRVIKFWTSAVESLGIFSKWQKYKKNFGIKNFRNWKFYELRKNEFLVLWSGGAWRRFVLKHVESRRKRGKCSKKYSRQFSNLRRNWIWFRTESIRCHLQSGLYYSYCRQKTFVSAIFCT